VGTYNLMNKSDFLIKKKSEKQQNLIKCSKKLSDLDSVIYLSSQIPGPGSHNPHVINF